MLASSRTSVPRETSHKDSTTFADGSLPSLTTITGLMSEMLRVQREQSTRLDEQAQIMERQSRMITEIQEHMRGVDEIAVQLNALSSTLQGLSELHSEQLAIVSQRVEELTSKVSSSLSVTERKVNAPDPQYELMEHEEPDSRYDIITLPQPSVQTSPVPAPRQPIPLDSHATAELLRRHREKDGKPSLVGIELCVAAGADVTARINDEAKTPLINRFIRNDYTNGVKACLRSPSCIDFTAANKHGWTLLHIIVTKEEWITAYLPLVLDRVLGAVHGPNSSNPDKIDWGQKNNDGHECISIAADWRNLHYFWRVVRERGVKYYTNYPKKIPITRPLFRSDYDCLSDEDKQRFEPKKGMI